MVGKWQSTILIICLSLDIYVCVYVPIYDSRDRVLSSPTTVKYTNYYTDTFLTSHTKGLKK